MIVLWLQRDFSVPISVVAGMEQGYTIWKNCLEIVFMLFMSTFPSNCKLLKSGMCLPYSHCCPQCLTLSWHIVGAESNLLNEWMIWIANCRRTLELSSATISNTTSYKNVRIKDNYGTQAVVFCDKNIFFTLVLV